MYLKNSMAKNILSSIRSNDDRIIMRTDTAPSIVGGHLINGIMLVLLIMMTALALSHWSVLQNLRINGLTLAIILGIVIGNSVFPKMERQLSRGVDFAKHYFLRAGVILFGFKITLQQIAAVGVAGMLVDATMLVLVFFSAYWLGTRLFKLDRETAVLIGAGSAICGAAAVIATEPVVKAQPHKVSLAVATVVVFGTTAMFLYPLMYPYLHISEQVYGLYVGSTVHEVAQVVGAGNAVSTAAGNTALIEKMLRVMLLVPFLLLLSRFFSRQEQYNGKGQRRTVTVPWFALAFLFMAVINSLNVVPETIVNSLVVIDNVLLTMAMAALGIRTHMGAIKQAGLRPMLLALVLFILLLVVGYFLNLIVY